MTREEAFNRIDAIIAKHEIDDEYVTITSAKDYDALRLARKLVEQEPKTGHWIWGVTGHECSSCGGYTCFEDSKPPKFCPNCGAKMVEPQESEDETEKHSGFGFGGID